MHRAAVFVLAVVACMTTLAGPAIAATDIPEPHGQLIVDDAKVLDGDIRRRIEDDLESYAKRSGNQVAMLLVQSTDGRSIEDYATDAFRSWGVGGKSQDTGAMLVIAMRDRRARIEVGYGLEAQLTDVEANALLQDQVLPRLKAGDPGEAVLAADTGIRRELGDTEVGPVPTPPPSDGSRDGGGSGLSTFLPLLPVFLIVIAGALGRRGFGSGIGPGIFYGGMGGWGSSGGFGGSNDAGGWGGFGGGSSGGGGASGSW